MNRQEVFNEVFEKLSTQGRKSKAHVEGYFSDLHLVLGCAYRSPNGDKCAIGHLIPDSLYSEEIEGTNIYYDPETNSMYDHEINSVLKKVYPDITDKDFMFLSELQEIHDNLPEDFLFASVFSENMKDFAIKWNLEFNYSSN